LRSAVSALHSEMVTLSELKTQADSLPSSDREDLLGHLIHGLGSPAEPIDDEEVEARERDMDAGRVDLVSHEEFSSIVRD